MDEFDLSEDGNAELIALTKRISELEIENSRIKEVVRNNELEEELEGIDCTSLEEKICMDGIRHIANLVETQQYDDKDVKNFDVLYKTLRVIRGQTAPSKKTKAASVADLLKIVEEK